MKIIDRVYGEIEINEPLVEELVQSRPVQRLKYINQSGATVLVDPKRDVNRFEHSVGVWYLLREYGASREEQVAGLLHDTPHTAFSHVVDYVFPNDDHTFHEKFTEKVIRESEIPEILSKYGVNLDEVLDVSKFYLLDAELPDLSADRIDYFFRDTRSDPLFPNSLIREFMKDLKVREGKFYFLDQSLATVYATLFINAGRMYWLDPTSHGSYFLLAGALKRAVCLGKLEESDFFRTDKEIWKVLINIQDEEIGQNVEALEHGTRFKYCSQEEADFWGPNKPRVVDPWVLNEGELVRVSKLVPRLGEMMEDYKQRYKWIGVKMV